MSGTGSNVRKIIEGEHSYKVTVIFTDNPKSNAQQFADECGLPCVTHDIHGQSAWALRKQYDFETLRLLEPYPFDLVALAGYNYIVSPVIIDKYLTINVHPADLSVVKNGERAYKGLGAEPSRKAILAGESSLCSTTHIAREQVDEGEILVRSPRVAVNRRKSAEWHQQQLKVHGDWVIYPLTLRWIAEGRFRFDRDVLLFDGKPIPNGVDLARESWRLADLNFSTKASKPSLLWDMTSSSSPHPKPLQNTLETPRISNS